MGRAGFEPTKPEGTWFTAKINDTFSSVGDIDAFIATYVPKFSLVVGAIFGGMALLLDTTAGRIGGRLNKIDEILGD